MNAQTPTPVPPKPVLTAESLGLGPQEAVAAHRAAQKEISGYSEAFDAALCQLDQDIEALHALRGLAARIVKKAVKESRYDGPGLLRLMDMLADGMDLRRSVLSRAYGQSMRRALSLIC